MRAATPTRWRRRRSLAHACAREIQRREDGDDSDTHSSP